MKFLPGLLISVYLMTVLIINIQACIQKFDNADQFSNASKVCSDYLKLSTDNPPSTEDMLKPDYDDKGLGKCILFAMDLITDEGHLDRDSLMDLLEDHAPKPIVLKLTETVSKCADTTEIDKVKATKNGTSKEENQPFSAFYSCFLASTEKLC